MAVATGQLVLYLLTADGLVRCRATDRLDGVEVVATDLEGDNLREVCQDPFEPRRFYAASTTDLYRSEDGGESWEQLAAGGVDYREFWSSSATRTAASTSATTRVRAGSG
jgi:hypothetical protein